MAKQWLYHCQTMVDHGWKPCLTMVKQWLTMVYPCSSRRELANRTDHASSGRLQETRTTENYKIASPGRFTRGSN